MRTIASAHAATVAQVALAWVLTSAPGAVPIPGTTRPERVAENVAALDLVLTDDELRILDEAFPLGAAVGSAIRPL